MDEILRDIIHKDLILYIDIILISSENYKQHVEALRKVLQNLQDQQLWFKNRKCQFFTKLFDVLEHILTSEGRFADPLKVQKILDFPEPRDK